MEDEFDVPSGRTLRGADLLSPTGRPFPRGCRNRLPTLEEGLEIIMDGLRVLEQASWRRGGIAVINVCRRNSPFHRNGARARAAARGRLLELLNASLAADGRYAHVVEDEERRDGLPALAAGLVHRDPAPAARRCARDGNSGGDAARATAVYAPQYQVAGTTSCCNWPAWSPIPCSSRRNQPPWPRP